MKSQKKVELMPVYGDSDTATVLAKLKKFLRRKASRSPKNQSKLNEINFVRQFLYVYTRVQSAAHRGVPRGGVNYLLDCI